MNAKVKPESMSVVQRAVHALSKAESEAKLKELAQASVAITTVADKPSYDACHDARMRLKTVRVLIEKTGKAAREDATAFNKAVIAEEKRLLAIITPEEERLAGMQKRFDDALEAEKQAKIAAELARVDQIQWMITEMREAVNWKNGNASSAEIALQITAIEDTPIEEGTYAEFTPQAEDAKTATLARLKLMHASALEREAEAERVRLERAELAQLRADREARDRIERENKAKTDAEASRLAAPVAPVVRAPEPPPFEVPEPEPPPRPIIEFGRSRPSDEELIQCVAEHFDVSPFEAFEWLIALQTPVAA